MQSFHPRIRPLNFLIEVVNHPILLGVALLRDLCYVLHTLDGGPELPDRVVPVHAQVVAAAPLRHRNRRKVVVIVGLTRRRTIQCAASCRSSAFFPGTREFTSRDSDYIFSTPP